MTSYHFYPTQAECNRIPCQGARVKTGGGHCDIDDQQQVSQTVIVSFGDIK